jgi:hypothetical protein
MTPLLFWPGWETVLFDAVPLEMLFRMNYAEAFFMI